MIPLVLFITALSSGFLEASNSIFLTRRPPMLCEIQIIGLSPTPAALSLLRSSLLLNAMDFLSVGHLALQSLRLVSYSTDMIRSAGQSLASHVLGQHVVYLSSSATAFSVRARWLSCWRQVLNACPTLGMEHIYSVLVFLTHSFSVQVSQGSGGVGSLHNMAGFQGFCHERYPS